SGTGTSRSSPAPHAAARQAHCPTSAAAGRRSHRTGTPSTSPPSGRAGPSSPWARPAPGVSSRPASARRRAARARSASVPPGRASLLRQSRISGGGRRHLLDLHAPHLRPFLEVLPDDLPGPREGELVAERDGVV